MKLNLGNEESERTQATAAKAGRPSRVGQPRHRLLPSIRRRIRRPVGGTGPANSPAGEPSSLGRRPAQGAGPHLRQRHIHGIFYVLRTGCQWKALDATGIPQRVNPHPLGGGRPRAPDRTFAGCHGHLLRLHRPSALPGMGRRRGVSGAVADGAGTLRRIAGSGLGLAEHGRGHDQIPLGRGGKPVPTPRTGVRLGSSAVC